MSSTEETQATEYDPRKLELAFQLLILAEIKKLGRAQDRNEKTRERLESEIAELQAHHTLMREEIKVLHKSKDVGLLISWPFSYLPLRTLADKYWGSRIFLRSLARLWEGVAMKSPEQLWYVLSAAG